MANVIFGLRCIYWRNEASRWGVRSCSAVALAWFWVAGGARAVFCDVSCWCPHSWSCWPLRNALPEEDGSPSGSERITKGMRSDMGADEEEVPAQGCVFSLTAGCGSKVHKPEALCWKRLPKTVLNLCKMIVRVLWPGLWQHWSIIGDLCHSVSGLWCAFACDSASRAMARPGQPKVAWVCGPEWLGLGGLGWHILTPSGK